MSKLQAVLELVDKISEPLQRINGLVDQFNGKANDSAQATQNLQDKANGAGAATTGMAAGAARGGLALGALATAAAGAFAAVGGLTAAFTAMNNAINDLDRLDQLGQRLGTTAQELRELTNVAVQNGLSLDQLANGMMRLSRNIARAGEGNARASAAFRQLGIDVKNTDGSLKSSEQVFNEIADAFQKMEDGPKKAAIAMQLFGGQAAAIIPILNSGSEAISGLREEANELGILTPEAFNAAASSAAAFNDNIDKLKTIFAEFFMALSAEVLPALVTLTEAMITSYKEGGTLRDVLTGIVTVTELLMPVFKAAILIVDSLANIFRILGLAIGAAMASQQAFLTGNWSQIRTIQQAFAEDVKKIAEEHVALQYAMFGTEEAAESTSAAGVAAANAMADAQDGVADSVNNTKTALQSLREQIEEQTANVGLDEFDRYRRQAMLASNEQIANDRAANPNEDLQQIVDRAHAEYAATIIAINALEEKTLAEEAAREATERSSEATDKNSASTRANTTEKERAREAQERLLESANQTVEGMEFEVQLLEKELELIGASKEERDAAIQSMLDEAEIRKLTAGLTEENAAAIRTEIQALQARRNAANEGIATGEAAAEQARNDADTARREQEDRDARRTSLLRNTDAAEYEALMEDRAFLDAEYAAGRIQSEEQYYQAVEEINNRVKDLHARNADEMTQFWMDFARNTEDIFGNFFFDVMQGNFTNLADDFKRMIDRMVAQALAAKLTQALFGADFAGTGVGGGLFGSLFGGARANGGPVSAGKAYLVGERGPEILMPNTSGTIIPNHQLSAGQSGQVQINITAMDSQDVRRALEKNSRWVAGLVNSSNRTYNLGV